ncbi:MULTISPECIES: hypothetical protein [unclassified Caballeronia]|uniref:hypothetical protein n=1 Tax=unclassified Caballeronia TaxID=2646786 RepID=UPI002864CB8A|nr:MULTISPECIES: hypothetical protein [unclassified Caballeronia]MDR5751136.1 hypothetical protein [Caballeronia sp. LZ024]MDR5844727.1 hypothetical protein [Caballeronia sp. LZ031]
MAHEIDQILKYEGGTPGHFWIFERVREVKSAAETYFTPRGEWSNAHLKWPLNKKRTEAELRERGEEWMKEHRAALTGYCMLRAQGVHPQVAYIVTFADKSELDARLVDRSFHGANFLESLPAVRGEYKQIRQGLSILPAAKEMLVEVDRLLTVAKDPAERAALWNWRGRLTFIIDQHEAAAKK